MKALPSFTLHGLFSSPALSLKLLHKAHRGDHFSDQCCQLQTSVLVLTSCCPALPSILNGSNAGNFKGATNEFCYCNNRFLQGGQKFGSSQTGQVPCFCFCFLDSLSPSLTSQLEQVEISPLSFTSLYPVVEVHAKLWTYRPSSNSGLLEDCVSRAEAFNYFIRSAVLQSTSIYISTISSCTTCID